MAYTKKQEGAFVLRVVKVLKITHKMYLMPLNSMLKNGQNAKFFIIYILNTHKKIHEGKLELPIAK